MPTLGELIKPSVGTRGSKMNLGTTALRQGFPDISTMCEVHKSLHITGDAIYSGSQPQNPKK